MYVLEGKIIVCVVLELPECSLEFGDSVLPVFAVVVRKKPVRVVRRNIGDLFAHELTHSLSVESLQPVLKCLVAVCSWPVLEC